MKKLIVCIVLSFAAGFIVKTFIFPGKLQSTIRIDRATVSYQQQMQSGRFEAGQRWNSVYLIAGNYRVQLSNGQETIASGRLSLGPDEITVFDLNIDAKAAKKLNATEIDILYRPTTQTDPGDIIFK